MPEGDLTVAQWTKRRLSSADCVHRSISSAYWKQIDDDNEREGFLNLEKSKQRSS